MCGIHLIVDKRAQLGGIEIGRMMNAGQHRGPDSSGMLALRTGRQTCYFGHNRLQITDLRRVADQPMTSPDGRYVLLYNGAIYNYRELRKQLEINYNFRTQSDTEVLLYWLIEKGLTGLAQVNGMFALAFYDQQAEQLVLARDTWGIKPLYYFENEKYLVVSSEIKSLLASGLMERTPDWEQIPHYLQFKFARRPGTFYKNVWEAIPGTVLQSTPGYYLREEKLPKIQPIPYQPPTLSNLTVQKHLEDLLQAATVRYLQADVPAGLFLSGGLDSTLLLALARKAGISQLPAFTITYPDEDQPHATQDGFYARQAARQFGADLQEVEVSRRMLENFREWLPMLDQPIGDGAAWLTYLLAQQAKKEVTVVLTGAGADELFGGYNRHWAYYQYLKNYRWLQRIIPSAHRIAASLPITSDRSRLFHKLTTQLHISPAQTFANFTSHLNTHFRFTAEFGAETNGFVADIQPPDQGDFIETYLGAALRHDQQHYLPGDVLAITDRMTMWHGLEARLPYLDAALADFAQSLPAVYRLQQGRKWLLKSLLTQMGGGEFANRRKEGFGMPLGHWLRNRAGKSLVSLLQNPKCEIYRVLLYNDVQTMLKVHLSGQRDYTSEIWTLLVLTGWLQWELNGTMAFQGY